MVNGRDVARIAGVSQTTVSRVLNGSDKVRPETKEKVLAALQGYRPNAHARSMRTNRTDTIGLVASQITNPYFPELVESLCAAARRHGLRTLLWSESDPDATAATDGARMGVVDGICFASATVDGRGVESVAETGVPVVLVNRGLYGASMDQVTSDNAAIGAIAARYLISAGRRAPALIFSREVVRGIGERRDAFLGGLAGAGLDVPAAWRTEGGLDFDSGYQGVHSVFAGGGDQPDSLFCANDLIAFGAMSALRDRGVRVPDDVWVVGVDDLPMSAWNTFDLTTIRQPIEKLAEQAIDRLVARINGDDSPPIDIRIGVELIVRGSTAGHLHSK